MTADRNRITGYVCVVAAIVVWCASVALSAGGSPRRLTQQPPSPASAPAAAQQPAAQGGFAGDDTCKVCHEAEGKSLGTTLHGKAQNPRTPAASGHTCETCHGPGQAHAESSGDIT